MAFLPNGDLVTACADYATRIWTPSPERAAPPEAQEVSTLARIPNQITTYVLCISPSRNPLLEPLSQWIHQCSCNHVALSNV